MKRIISMVMSILMIMTMFCGVLTVSSTAAAEDIPAVVANITVDAGKVDADGVFEVKYWFKDYTPYGLHGCGFSVTWDAEKVEPVVQDTVSLRVDGVSSSYDAYLNIENASLLCEAFDEWKDTTYVSPMISCAKGKGKTTKEVFSVNSVVMLASGASVEYPDPFGTSDDYLTMLEEEYDVTADDILSGVEYDATKGVLLATAKFKKLEGASGSLEMTVNVNDTTCAEEPFSTTPIPYTSRVTVTTDTVDLGEAPAVETPALPEGMTLTVNDNADVRTTVDYTGMRFSASVSVTNTDAWDQVAEMGVAIVKSGTTPGKDTTLKIPARIENVNGDYIQERVNNEDGTIASFTDGLLDTAKEKDEITFTGVLSNVEKGNYDQDFTAYVYVRLNDAENTVIYSENSTCTRNMQAVCQAAIGDTDVDNYNEYQAKVQAIMDLYA